MAVVGALKQSRGKLLLKPDMGKRSQGRENGAQGRSGDLVRDEK